MEKIDKILTLIIVIIGILVFISISIKIINLDGHSTTYIEIGFFIILVLGYFGYLYYRKVFNVVVAAWLVSTLICGAAAVGIWFSSIRYYPYLMRGWFGVALLASLLCMGGVYKVWLSISYGRGFLLAVIHVAVSLILFVVAYL